MTLPDVPEDVYNQWQTDEFNRSTDNRIGGISFEAQANDRIEQLAVPPPAPLPSPPDVTESLNRIGGWATPTPQPAPAPEPAPPPPTPSPQPASPPSAAAAVAPTPAPPPTQGPAPAPTPQSDSGVQGWIGSALGAVQQAGGDVNTFAQHFKSDASDMFGSALGAAQAAGADLGQFASSLPALPQPAAPSIASPSGVAVPPGGDLQAYARQAAQKAGVDPDIFVRQIQQESGFNPSAKSGAGAIGIAQFMPGTAQGMGIDPTDPYAALDAAARLDAQHLQKYGGDYSKALAAYNAGPGNVDKYGGVPPFEETQRYVNTILGGQQPPISPSESLGRVGGWAQPTASRISQFGDAQLSNDEAYSACGPAAAVRFAQAYGRNPTLREAVDLAKTVGWTEASGMAGIGSEQQLLQKMGIPTRLVGADVSAMAREAQTGNPITISTPGHYFYADGYDPNSGAFHVGRSGTDLKNGAEWMTPDQMQRVMGPIQGALFADNPNVPAPSTSDQTSNPGGFLDRAKDSFMSSLQGLGSTGQDILNALGMAGDDARARQAAQLPGGAFNRLEPGSEGGPPQYTDFGKAAALSGPQSPGDAFVDLNRGIRNAIEPGAGQRTEDTMDLSPPDYATLRARQEQFGIPPAEPGSIRDQVERGQLDIRDLTPAQGLAYNAQVGQTAPGAEFSAYQQAQAARRSAVEQYNPLTDVGPSVDVPGIGQVKPIGAASNMALDILTDPTTWLLGGPIADAAEAAISRAIPGAAPAIVKAIAKAGLEGAGWGGIQAVGTPNVTPQEAVSDILGGAGMGIGMHGASAAAGKVLGPVARAIGDRLRGPGLDEAVAQGAPGIDLSTRTATPEDLQQLASVLSPAGRVTAKAGVDQIPWAPANPPPDGIFPRAEPATVWPDEAKKAPPDSSMDKYAKSGGLFHEAITGPIADQVHAALNAGPITDQERAAAQSLLDEFAGAKSSVFAGYPSAQNADNLAMLMRQLGALADAGAGERKWYEHSSADIMDRAQNDPVKAEKIAQLVANYSPKTPVSDNMNKALTAYYQHQAGEPGITAPAMPARNDAAYNLLYKGIDWAGAKTNNFYRNLMFHIDKNKWGELGKVDMGNGVRQTGATIDIWMQRALNSIRKAPGNQGAYDFAARLVSKIGEDRGWRPDEAQAAIWSAAKAAWEHAESKGGKTSEAAGYHYGTALADRTAYPLAVDEALNHALQDSSGKDMLADAFGILGADGRAALPATRQSGFDPYLGREMTPEDEKAAKGVVQPAARAAANAYAAARAWLAGANEGGWARVFKSETKAAENAAVLAAPTGSMTPAQVAELQGHMDALTKPGATRVVPTDAGAWVLNESDSPNPAFQKAVEKAIAALQSVGAVTKTEARYDGEVFNHDWSLDPSGQTYLDTIRQSGSRYADQFAELQDLLGQRVRDARDAAGATSAESAASEATGGARGVTPADLEFRVGTNEEARAAVGGAWDPAGRVVGARPPEEGGLFDENGGLRDKASPLDSQLILPGRERMPDITEIYGPSGQPFKTIARGNIPAGGEATVPVSSYEAATRAPVEVTDEMKRLFPNLDYFGAGDPALQDTVRGIARDNQELARAYQQGTISHQQLIEDLAPRVGMTTEDFMNSKIGTAFNPAEQLVLNATAKHYADNLQDMAQQVQKRGLNADTGGLSAEEKLDFVRQAMEAAQLQNVARGGSATAARTLNQQKISMDRQLARAIVGPREQKAAEAALAEIDARNQKIQDLANRVKSTRAQAQEAMSQARQTATERGAKPKDVNGLLDRINRAYAELEAYQAMSLEEKGTDLQQREAARAERAAARAEALKNRDAPEQLLSALQDELAAERKIFKGHNKTWNIMADNAELTARKVENLRFTNPDNPVLSKLQSGAQDKGALAWLDANAQVAKRNADSANARLKRSWDDQMANTERRSNMAKQILQRMGGKGTDLSDDMIKKLADAMTSNDPMAAAKFLRSLQHVSWWDRLSILRYASMLSATTTHTAQAAANLGQLGLAMAAHPIAVGGDALASALTGGQRTRYMAELPAMMAGLKGGFANGAKDAATIMRTGINPADASRWLEANQRAGFGSGNAAIDFLAEGPLRTLEAGDALVRGGARGAYTNALAVRRAIQEGYGGSQRAERVKDILNNLEDYPQLIDDAEGLAKRIVMQEQRGEMRAFGAKQGPMGFAQSLVMPFVRTPWNVAAQGLGMTPAGFAAMARSIQQGNRGEAADRFAKATLGTGIMGLAYALAANGHLTGAMPTDPSEKSTLPPGWAPYSVRIDTPGGPSYVKYSNLGAVGVPLALGATAHEAFGRTGQTANPSDILGRFVGGFGRYMTDQTMLQGLSNLTDAITQPERKGENFLEGMSTQFMPYAALGRQLDRALGTSPRDPHGVLDALQAVYPGLSSRVQPRLDTWGEPVAQTQSGLGAFASPLSYSMEGQDPYLRLLHRSGVGIDAAPQDVASMQLTPDERRQFPDLAAPIIRRGIDAATSRSDWNQLTDDQRREILRRVVGNAHQSAGGLIIRNLSPAERTARHQQTLQRLAVVPGV